MNSIKIDIRREDIYNYLRYNRNGFRIVKIAKENNISIHRAEKAANAERGRIEKNTWNEGNR